MVKLTLEEKKLRQLRQQLFGKERTDPPKKSVTQSNPTLIQNKPTSSRSTPSDIHSIEETFMQKDLLKVLILSLFAIGGQFFLFYLSQQGIINLNIFHIF